MTVRFLSRTTYVNPAHPIVAVTPSHQHRHTCRVSVPQSLGNPLRSYFIMSSCSCVVRLLPTLKDNFEKGFVIAA
jgi:hypothetical protein